MYFKESFYGIRISILILRSYRLLSGLHTLDKPYET